MSHILSPTPLLQVEQLEDGIHHRLLIPFAVITHKGKILTAPAGFVTDFASVPWLFRRVFPMSGKYSRAAVIHDFVYQMGCCPRKEADHIFLEIMEALKVNRITRNSMYYSVRAGG